MKTPEVMVVRRVTTGIWSGNVRLSSAFTLIEIMVVVAIIGVIMAMGLPPIMHSLRPESVRKAAKDLQDVCNNARARAIMNGTITAVVFHPQERRFEVEGAGGGSESLPPGAGLSGQLPEDVEIKMVDVNLREYKDEETARVRFFPNGTCDEMRVVFHSPEKDEWRSVTLEVTTGLADIQSDMKKLDFQ